MSKQQLSFMKAVERTVKSIRRAQDLVKTDPERIEKGIKFHPAWEKDIYQAVEYMGIKPKDKEFCRIDQRGHYEPGNVCYVDAKTRAAQVMIRMEFSTKI